MQSTRKKNQGDPRPTARRRRRAADSAVLRHYQGRTTPSASCLQVHDSDYRKVGKVGIAVGCYVESCAKPKPLVVLPLELLIVKL